MRALSIPVATLACLAMPGSLCAQSRGVSIAGAGNLDPSPSTSPPASMAEITIPSHGARMNGFVYVAAGPGNHPVVLFLHGFPGNERNLDLAQAVRRAGYDAIYFDYRGTWGSGGQFSLGGGLEDTQAALAWVQSPGNAAKYHFDVKRIAVVGHSYGGWLALMSSGSFAPSVCVAGLAAWNVGAEAKRFATVPAERASSLDYFRVTSDPAGGPIRANANALLNEMSSHAAAWDYLSQAKANDSRALLLVAATRDSPDEDVAMHQRMAQAVRNAGSHQVKSVQYEDDHPFSSHRIALAEVLTQWLDSDCARTQGMR